MTCRSELSHFFRNCPTLKLKWSTLGQKESEENQCLQVSVSHCPTVSHFFRYIYYTRIICEHTQCVNSHARYARIGYIK